MSYLQSVKENIIVPESIDYQTYNAERPMYRKWIVAPTGSTEVKVSTSTVDTYFELTPNVINLSKSFLEYNVVIRNEVKELGDPDGEPNKKIYTFANKPNVQSIVLSTKSGAKLVEIDYVNRLMWVMGRKGMKYADYVSRHEVSLTSPATNTAREAKRWDGSAIRNPNEDSHIRGSSPDHGEGLSYNVRFPLGDVCETLLSMDKDIYLKENMTLKITWESSKMFGYAIERKEEKATVDGKEVVTTTYLPAVAISAPIKLTDIKLRLAIQTNRSIVESVIAAVGAGLKVEVPYVTVVRNPLTVKQHGQSSVNIRINNGMGKSLIKIIHTIFNSDDSGWKAFDNRTKVTEYFTQLNSQKLQDFTLNTGVVDEPGDDYQWNEEYMKNSAIVTPYQYYYSWFHEDNFSNVNNNSLFKESQLTLPGIPLDTEKTWYFSGIASDNEDVTHFSFIVARKTLNISQLGVTFQ